MSGRCSSDQFQSFEDSSDDFHGSSSSCDFEYDICWIPPQPMVSMVSMVYRCYRSVQNGGHLRGIDEGHSISTAWKGLRFGWELLDGPPLEVQVEHVAALPVTIRHTPVNCPAGWGSTLCANDLLPKLAQTVDFLQLPLSHPHFLFCIVNLISLFGWFWWALFTILRLIYIWWGQHRRQVWWANCYHKKTGRTSVQFKYYKKQITLGFSLRGWGVLKYIQWSPAVMFVGLQPPF